MMETVHDRSPRRLRTGLVLLLAGLLTACAGGLETRVSGNLSRLAPENTVAILPVEAVGKGDEASGRLLRKNLHANLKQSPYRIMEPYVVDSLLKKKGMTNPATYAAVNPMDFGEALGADAVLISRLNHVERSYLLLHSSIELSVSLQMVDTRTGEILWRADQTESDYQGIGKIPTGIFSALFSPIYFVTNKFNLGRMTAKLAEEITEPIKRPETARKIKKFRRPLYASAARKELEDIRKNASAAPESEFAQAPLTESPLPMLAPVSQVAGFAPAAPPAPAPEPQPRGEEPVDAVRYTIQVGAYRDQDSAMKITQGLARKGYRAFIAPLTTGKTTLYRVHVEQFERKEEAVELARKLRRQENINNFVTSL